MQDLNLTPQQWDAVDATITAENIASIEYIRIAYSVSRGRYGSCERKPYSHTDEKKDKKDSPEVLSSAIIKIVLEREVCNVASSAYLPHSGKSRLGCEAGTVMKFVFIPFVYCWRAGSD